MPLDRIPAALGAIVSRLLGELGAFERRLLWPEQRNGIGMSLDRTIPETPQNHGLWDEILGLLQGLPKAECLRVF